MYYIVRTDVLYNCYKYNIFNEVQILKFKIIIIIIEVFIYIP